MENLTNNTIAINFITSIDTDEDCDASNNNTIEIMINDKADKVLKEHFH